MYSLYGPGLINQYQRWQCFYPKNASRRTLKVQSDLGSDLIVFNCLLNNRLALFSIDRNQLKLFRVIFAKGALQKFHLFKTRGTPRGPEIQNNHLALVGLNRIIRTTRRQIRQFKFGQHKFTSNALVVWAQQGSLSAAALVRSHQHALARSHLRHQQRFLLKCGHRHLTTSTILSLTFTASA